MSFTFNPDVGQQLQQQLALNLEKAAIYFKGKVKEALNRSQEQYHTVGDKGVWYHGLDPSAPGEEPKKVTGFLQRSIAHAMSEDKQKAFVGSNLDYALYLELGTVKMAPRPFLRSVLLQEQETIARIIATGHS